MQAPTRQVDEETLRQLLAVQAESDTLDFKREIHLDRRRDVVLLAKDIAAMSATGGHLVIGADERGVPTGALAERDLVLLDEASLAAKLARYLPPLTAFRTAWHRICGDAVALIAVLPHPLGVCVMAADGDHDGGTEFRAGDVFVRRGTANQRWRERDVSAFLERQRETVREDVRRELTEDFRLALRDAQAASPQPAQPPLDWALDVDTFVEAAVSQLRAGDDLKIRSLLSGVPATLAAARSERAIQRTAEALDRVGALMCELLIAGRHDLLVIAVRTLASSWVTRMGSRHPAEPVPGSLLGIMQLERLFPVGALAVRSHDWDTVRSLATAPVRGVGRLGPHWLRAAQRAAEREDAFNRYAQPRPARVAVISLALDTVGRLPRLAPDVATDDEALTTSLCEFDLLATLATLDTDPDAEGTLDTANFAGWFSHRTDPIVLELLDERASVRRAIYPRSDAELAEALLVVARRAAAGDMSGTWDGFEDPRVGRFLNRHLKAAAR
jgi:hypothetical protein